MADTICSATYSMLHYSSLQCQKPHLQKRFRCCILPCVVLCMCRPHLPPASSPGIRDQYLVRSCDTPTSSWVLRKLIRNKLYLKSRTSGGRAEAQCLHLEYVRDTDSSAYAIIFCTSDELVLTLVRFAMLAIAPYSQHEVLQSRASTALSWWWSHTKVDPLKRSMARSKKAFAGVSAAASR